MMDALLYSETSLLTRTTQRNIPEDNILHSHRPEKLKAYIAVYFSEILVDLIVLHDIVLQQMSPIRFHESIVASVYFIACSAISCH
jgi:hypothetical protein